jgi:hypothetical protein
MPKLIMAASFDPILGSGVDIGEAIGGVSASDIPPALGILPEGIDKPEGLPPPPERGPRINSINLSAGTLIKTPYVPFVTTYKPLVNK